jgi:hypothetical protein
MVARRPRVVGWFRRLGKAADTLKKGNTMATLNPAAVIPRLESFFIAWKKLRATKTFAGLTPDQFDTQKITPCRTARVAVAEAEAQRKAAINRRDEIDQAALDTMALIVNAVKGDSTEGENGDLYEAMGFVRKSERKSGLSRKKAAPAAK